MPRRKSAIAKKADENAESQTVNKSKRLSSNQNSTSISENVKELNNDNKPENDNETLYFLIEQKLTYLNTVAKVCMSWWVSSIVFCGTILAAVWLRRAELVDSGIIKLLGIAVAGFFASFIYFGITAIWCLNKLKTEISDLIKSLKSANSKQIPETAFKIEIDSIKRAIEIGIGTFILILIVWILLCLNLYQGCCKNL